MPWSVRVVGRAPDVVPRSLSARAVLVRLGAVLATALVAVTVLAGFGAQWLAEREAVNDAAQTTNVLAEAVIRPALTDALAAGILPPSRRSTRSSGRRCWGPMSSA